MTQHIPEQASNASPRVTQRTALLILITVIAVSVIVLTTYVLIMTPKLPDWTGFNPKTLWDVLDLVFVPLGLALVAYFFSQAQKKYELDIAAKNRATDQKIAAENRDADQNNARSRDNEAALQTYFDRMTDLLLIHKLKEAKDLSVEAKRIAQARTLNTLQRLDGERKGHLVQFLYSANLISTPQPHISLNGADLRKAELSSAQAELSGVDYSGVHLAGADLREAYFNAALLQGANLNKADLRNAKLQNTVLRDTILDEANLNDAKLNFAVAPGARFRRARLGKADLSGANFSGADLSEADLTNAVFESTDLTGAILTGATLTGVDLTQAITDSRTRLPKTASPRRRA